MAVAGRSFISRRLSFARPVILLLLMPVGAWAGGAGRAEKPMAPSAHQGRPLVLSDEQILKSYSYERLQAASTYLFALIESEGSSPIRILPCDPSIAKAKEWHSGTLRYLVEEKEKAEVETYKNDPRAYAARIKNCARRFACEAYYSVLSSAGEELQANATHRKLLDETQAGAKSQTTEKTRAWAKQQTWFCKSSLRRYLEAQQP